LISLAVQLDFCLVSRIGEIKALKWSDIDYKNGTIRLQRQFLSSQEVNDDLTFKETQHYSVDYVKGNTSQGFRDLPLIPRALEILDRIKSINPNSEYLFMNNNDMPLTTITFNRHLKAICKELSIPYRSSHKIRFCVASALYKEDIPATVIQELLGHTTLAMTLHYIRNVTPKNETFSQITAILN
jgi:integrase